MSTYSGVAQASPLSANLPNQTLHHVRLDPTTDALFLVNRSAPVTVAAMTNKVEVFVLSDSFTTKIQRTYFDIFYNQIHIIPTKVDLGAVASDTTSSFSIWNAYLESVTFQSVTGLANTQGISLGTITLPKLLKSLSFTTVTLNVMGIGSASIDLTLGLVFSTSTSYVQVIGDRSRLLALSHNWGKGAYTVVLEYKTEIWASRSGREQRRSIRQSPRKTIEMEINPSKSELRDTQRALDSWHSNVFGIPEITKQARTAIKHLAGDTEFVLTEQVPDWIASGVSVIIRCGRRQEIRQVNGVAGSTVSMSNTSSEVWESGSLIHPLLATRLDNSTAFTLLTDTVGTSAIKFEVVPASELYVEPPIAPLFFKGVELFTMRPDWGTSPKLSFSSESEDVDFGFGSVARFNPVEFNSRTLQLGYTSLNAKTSYLVIDFFNRMLGQAGEFFMPTWQNDIALKELSLSGTRVISLECPYFARDYADTKILKALAIYFNDGVTQYVEVESIAQSTLLGVNSSVITCKDDFIQDVSPSNVRMVSWLPVWRLASDAINIEWITDTVSQISITARTLEDLT